MDKRHQNPQAHSLAALPQPAAVSPPRRRQPGAPPIRVLPGEIEQLERAYSFRWPAEVVSFVQAHPFLAPLLWEAREQVTRRFGPSCTVNLEVVSEPEVQGVVELFGYITTTLAPEEAGDRLRQFDREWFLQRVPRAKGLLNFDVEFR